MTFTKNVRGYYEVRVKQENGKYRRFSLKTGNKEEALRIVQESKLKEIELAAQMGVLSNGVFSTLVNGSRGITVREAIEPWKRQLEYERKSPHTIHDMEIWVNAWMEWGNHMRMPVAQIEMEHLDPWVNAEGPRKSGTRLVMLNALRSFCSFCSSKGWLNGNPAALVKVDLSTLLHSQKETLQRPIFDEDEIQRLLDATAPGGSCESEFWHAAILIGRWTGLRLGDICCLEWNCFDFDNGTISVWTRKRDRRIHLFVEPAVLEAVKVLPREDEQFLFPMQRDVILDPQYRASLSSQFWKILRTVGIFGRSFHCLRATYITDCDAKGIPIEHISRNVGHWNEDITKSYIRP